LALEFCISDLIELEEVWNFLIVEEAFGFELAMIPGEGLMPFSNFLFAAVLKFICD
jgi:hypothetical protein